MTTIAYRDGVVAADEQSEVNGWRNPHGAPKLFRDPKTGAVYAITGDQASATVAVKNLILGKDPKVNDNSRVIEFRSGAEMAIIVHEDGACFEISPVPEFAAWGSGMPAALGALYAGASAEEAVRIAGLIDTSTGGAVQSMPVWGKTTS